MSSIKQFVLGIALVAATGLASAAGISLSPGTPQPLGYDCTGGNGGTDTNFLQTCPGYNVSAVLQYKNDTPSTESGGLAGSYASVVNGDLSGGTITWTGPQAVLCSGGFSCWLVVKDGNNDPGRYGFNLTGLWDGVSTITLSGFWPAQGGISHWALFGTAGTPECTVDCGGNTTPEPATLALVGVTLAMLGLSRRRRS